MDLQQACIDRDGKDEGTRTFNNIVDQAKALFEEGRVFELEEMLYDEGFELDYLFSLIDLLG